MNHMQCTVEQKCTGPTKAMTVKQFSKKVSQFCLANGGRVKDYKTEYSEAAYLLLTLYGDIKIRAIDDWIACQFVDGVRAKPLTGQTHVPHGKWNFHGTSKSRADTFSEFESALLRILPNQTQGAIQ
jgi:hypothetical protein